PEKRLPASAYDAPTNERIYHVMTEQAAAALSAGFTAIIDAAFLREAERKSAAEIAKQAGVPFWGLWLDAPQDVLTKRVRARTGDASDADEAIVRQQLAYDIGKMDWHRIDAATDTHAQLAAVLALLRSTKATSGSEA